MLGQRVVVGAGQGAGIADVELFLPGLGLALGVLDRHAGGIERVAQPPHDMLLLGGLEDVIVLIVTADRFEVAIAVAAQLIERFAEQEEFQLGRHHGGEAHRLEPRDLRLQDLPRGVRDGLVGVVVEDVAQHHGGAV